MSIPLMKFTWSGEALVPTHPRFADKHFVIGETYRISTERSEKSHKHYFAVIRRAWETLPEDISAEFPTPESLRARALIMTGHAKTRQIVARDEKQALDLAAFIQGDREDYAVVTPVGQVVTVLTPMSNAYKAMGRDEFQKCKRDVFEYCAMLCGVSVEALEKHAREDAD